MLEGNGNATVAKLVQKLKPKPAKVIIVTDPLPGIRAKLGPLMDGTVKNTLNWHYKMVRPLPTYTEDVLLHGVVVSDCSKGCADLCKVTGGKDPTHDNWEGNSDSMFDTLTHITKAEAKTGDMIVLGQGGRLHAMMIRSALGGDPLCWSHGSEDGPKFVPLSAEVAYHAALFPDGDVVTYLRLAAA